jgi:hypothetical protein
MVPPVTKAHSYAAGAVAELRRSAARPSRGAGQANGGFGDRDA